MSGAETISPEGWLKARRKDLDLTQDALAERVGCSPDTIRKIEAGKQRPSQQLAGLLLGALGLPVEERPAAVRLLRALAPPAVPPGAGATAAPASPTPAPAPTGGTPHRLPIPATSLIGRGAEVGRVREMLRGEARLVTLLGPPGIGKTRLALAAAHALRDEFADGVGFVALAPLTDPDLVVPSVAGVLGVTEAAGEPLIGRVVGYLRDKQVLLVLDNFEHLPAAAAPVDRLLQDAPGLKVLATSRAPLRVYGEQEYPVPALAVPDAQTNPSPGELVQYDAVRLFVERARAIAPDFAITRANAAAAGAICRRLDGLPLAIELAAARVRLFAPQALLARLDQRLQVLTGGAQERTTRQQTLRGAIDWSYNLLTGGEQQLFRRLAVFQGGRTLEALEAVCNVGGTLAVAVLEGVESLVEKNLLKQREGRDGEPRFWMLETLQEYAREKLVQSGEVAALEREHARYFMELAEQAAPHLTGGGQQEKESLGRLEEEHDNIRAALRWARADKDSAAERAEGVWVGLRLAGALGRFWEVGGYWREGREQLAGLLALEAVEAAPAGPGQPSADARRYRAKALSAAGVLTYWLGDNTTARALTEESLVLWRELGDKPSLAFELSSLGRAVKMQGDYATARALFEESLALWRELGDKQGNATPLLLLGNVAYDQGDYATARALFEESLARKRELGDQATIAGDLEWLGHVAIAQGDYATARPLFEEGLALKRAFGDKLRIADSLRSNGQLAYVQGDYDAAQAWFEESLVLARESGHKWGLVCSLSNLGLVAYERGDYAAARPLVEESLVLARELGDKLNIAAALVYLGGLAVACAGSRVLPGRATGQMGDTARAEQGGVERGARLLGAAEALLESMGVKLEPHDRRIHARVNTAARADLGAEAFERARQQGRAMGMEQAIGFALGAKP